MAGRIYYSYFEEFDATDWFPEIFEYKLDGGKFKMNFDKVVAHFSIGFLKHEASFPYGDEDYTLIHPLTGDKIELTTFTVRFEFFGDGKRIK